MKKLLKTLGWGVPVLLVCFLLLPFVLSEREKENPQEMELRFSEPQIYSGNPFTAFMDRLRSVFSTDREKDSPTAEDNATLLSLGNTSSKNKSKNHRRAATARSKNRNKLASSGSAKAETGNQPLTADSDGDTLDLPQTDEWVIGEQKMPLVAAKGMHETKLTDSPYERQRAVKSADDLIAAQENIPQSVSGKKGSIWDTYVVSPLKHLFGKNNDKANATERAMPQIAYRRSVRANEDYSVGNADTSDKGNLSNHHNAAARIHNMIDDIAAMRANMQYPNPKTDSERESRERMIAAERKKITQDLNRAYTAEAEKQKRIFGPIPNQMEALIDLSKKEKEEKEKEKEEEEEKTKDYFIRLAPWETQQEFMKEHDKAQEITPAENAPKVLLALKADGHLFSKDNEKLYYERINAFYNEDGSSNRANIPTYNNRYADMRYMFEKNEACSSGKQKCYWIINKEYKGKNEEAVSAYETGVFLAGGKPAGDELDLMTPESKNAQQYTEDFVNMMHSPKIFQQLIENTKSMGFTDQEAKDIVELSYNSPEMQAKLDKEYREQAAYNIEAAPVVLVTAEQMDQIAQKMSNVSEKEQGGMIAASDWDTFFDLSQDITSVPTPTVLVTTTRPLTEYKDEKDEQGHLRGGGAGAYSKDLIQGLTNASKIAKKTLEPMIADSTAELLKKMLDTKEATTPKRSKQ